MSKPSLLITGLPWDHPAVKAIADPQQIKVMLEKTVTDLQEAGYTDFTPVWIGPEDGYGQLADKLKEKHWHGIIIGAGVRMSPGLTPFLEGLIQTVRDVSPHTQVLFNTSPKDNLEAAQRCKYP